MSAATAPARQKSDRGVVALFSLTMLVSAMLLFAVQPMVARFVLPTFGSAPSVWAVALVFFQAVLLLGYLYAHVSSTKLGPHRALGLHAVLLLAAGDRPAARRARGDRRRRDREPGVGAARPARGVDRPAVLRRLLDRPAAAALAVPTRTTRPGATRTSCTGRATSAA